LIRIASHDVGSNISLALGYGTIVSHNVPPYGRAGLYRQTAELRDLLNDYREDPVSNDAALRGPIFDLIASAGLDADCPYIDPATGRGLHASTSRRNVNAFCGIGGALRGCLRGVWGLLGGIKGCSGCILCQK
jgi:hypothetical protein